MLSMVDWVSCELYGLFWVILFWLEGDVVYLVLEGYWVLLFGCEFVYGVFDCWSFCCDWYCCEVGLEFLDYLCCDGWWEIGESFYEQYYVVVGFWLVLLVGICCGDMLVMQVGRVLYLNYVGIYLGNDWCLDSELVQVFGGDGLFLLYYLYGWLLI